MRKNSDIEGFHVGSSDGQIDKLNETVITKMTEVTGAGDAVIMAAIVMVAVYGDGEKG